MASPVTNTGISRNNSDKDVADNSQDVTTELNIAVLLEMLRGEGSESSIIGAIIAAQSRLTQLVSTYHRVLTEPINAKDSDMIIKALQARQQDGNVNLTSTDNRASASESINPSPMEQQIIDTHTQQDLVLHTKAAHDQGFKAGFAAANYTHRKNVEARLQAAHDHGYKSGIAKFRAQHQKDIETHLKEAYEHDLIAGTSKAAVRDKEIRR